jgi:hypothetical protein
MAKRSRVKRLIWRIGSVILIFVNFIEHIKHSLNSNLMSSIDVNGIFRWADYIMSQTGNNANITYNLTTKLWSVFYSTWMWHVIYNIRITEGSDSGQFFERSMSQEKSNNERYIQLTVQWNSTWLFTFNDWIDSKST